MTNNESGQSTIEFALTLVLLLGLVFFFMQLSLVMGVGNYVHYVTFMSARAYLSAGSSPDDQASRAKQVVIGTLKAGPTLENVDRFPMVAASVGGGDLRGMDIGDSHYQPGVRDYSWLQGIRYSFRSKLFLLPIGGSAGGNRTSANLGPSANQGSLLQLSSESWLGREPTESDCIGVMKSSATGLVVYDNGC